MVLNVNCNDLEGGEAFAYGWRFLLTIEFFVYSPLRCSGRTFPLQAKRASTSGTLQGAGRKGEKSARGREVQCQLAVCGETP